MRSIAGKMDYHKLIVHPIFILQIKVARLFETKAPVIFRSAKHNDKIVWKFPAKAQSLAAQLRADAL
jgi:hypothetical protein